MRPSPDQLALYRIARELVMIQPGELNPRDYNILGILRTAGYVDSVDNSDVRSARLWYIPEDTAEFCYPHLNPDDLPSTEVEIIEVLEQNIPF